MTQPLALIVYERLLPGSQLVNRLQDLNYRVQVVAKPEQLVEVAQNAKPLVVLADLEPARQQAFSALTKLRQNAATKHLPVIAFGADEGDQLKAQAEAAGVTLLVSHTAVLNYLPQLLDQALQLD
jgi:PleD family two-component response regulator